MKCPTCGNALKKELLDDNIQQAQGCWTCFKCGSKWFIIQLKEGDVAQSVERSPEEAGGGGSNPSVTTDDAL